jgi:alpha-glucosidase
VTFENLNPDKMTRDWWRGATIYQIYPRSFADSNGDGVGDLAGISTHLEYVASLGVDAIWLSPFFTSPMADFGYDVSDYCDVDPIFGTLDDFRVLLGKAHSLGLKVIIDQVYAHTSDAHPWFKESRASRSNPRADWYVWHDPKPDGTPPSNWQSVFGGPAWTWDARRGQYYLHNFLKEQPQLNLHNPDVANALLDVARFWLDLGVDGFRLDALNFSFHNRALTDNPPVIDTTAPSVRTRPFDFQHKIHNQSQPELMPFAERIRALTDQYDARFTLAEIGGEQADREMAEITQRDHRLNTAYSFNFLHANALTPKLVAETVSAWPDTADAGWPSWAFSNHDAMRVVSRWADGRDAASFAKLMNMLLLTLRGNAFLYYGEELGFVQADVPFERLRDPEAIANWPLTQNRDGARTPMAWHASEAHGGFSMAEPWLPMDMHHLAASVAAQEATSDSVLRATRALVAIRQASAALRFGSFEVLEAGEDILAFVRRTTQEAMLCVFNLGQTDAQYHADGSWQQLYALGGATAANDELPIISGYLARQST